MILQFMQILECIDFQYDKSMSDSALKNLILRIGKENLSMWLDLYQLINIVKYDQTSASQSRIAKRFNELLPHTLSNSDLAISGDDILKLGVPEGPMLGHILSKLLTIVNEYPNKNTWSQLVGYAKELKNALYS